MEHDDQNSPRPFTPAFPADNSFDGISFDAAGTYQGDASASPTPTPQPPVLPLPHTADFPVAAPYTAGVPDGFRTAIPDDADADHPDYRAIPAIRSATTRRTTARRAANSACPCVPAASSIFRVERATTYPVGVCRQSAIPCRSERRAHPQKPSTTAPDPAVQRQEGRTVLGESAG